MFNNNNKKPIKISRKLNITIRTYSIEVDKNFEGLYDPLIELKEDMITNREKKELEGAFKLNEEAQKVNQFNQRQVIFAKKLDKKTISLKRITKD